MVAAANTIKLSKRSKALFIIINHLHATDQTFDDCLVGGSPIPDHTPRFQRGQVGAKRFVYPVMSVSQKNG
jgi:hypothetical protein